MGSTFVGALTGLPARETLADMTLRVARRLNRVFQSQATGGGTNYLIDTDLLEANGVYDRGMVWILSDAHVGKVVPRIKSHMANRLNFGISLSSVLCAQQVETLTVLGTCTGNGDATVIVTAAGLGAPITLSVALTVAENTAALVAAKVRAALAANENIDDFGAISGTGADVVLTAKRAAANDTTLNISIANGTCTGLTAVPLSTNTTAGIAGPTYAVADAALPWQQLVAGINDSLRTVMVPKENSTLIGDGTLDEFTLPPGVNGVYHVEIGDDRYPSFHARERNGKLVFDAGFAPGADTLHVWYAQAHDQLVAAADLIHSDVNLNWLEAKAAFTIAKTARKLYGKDPRYDFETELQVAAQDLKEMRPNITTRIHYESAGTPE